MEGWAETAAEDKTWKRRGKAAEAASKFFVLLSKGLV
jgi:hypothetical protein